jgi:hypothetical protein
MLREFVGPWPRSLPMYTHSHGPRCGGRTEGGVRRSQQQETFCMGVIFVCVQLQQLLLCDGEVGYCCPSMMCWCCRSATVSMVTKHGTGIALLCVYILRHNRTDPCSLVWPQNPRQNVVSGAPTQCAKKAMCASYQCFVCSTD